MSNPKESWLGLSLSRRDVLKRLAAGAGATVLGSLMPSSIEPVQKPQESGPKPPEPLTPKPVVTEGAPSRIPVVPPTTPVAEAGAQASPAVRTAAPVRTIVAEAPARIPNPEAQPPVIYSDVLLTEELLVSDFLSTGGGGKAPASPTPTADTGQQEVLSFPIDPFEFTKLAFGLPKETEFKQVTEDPMLALYYDVAQATFRGTDGGSVEISERSKIRFFRFKVKHSPGTQEAVLNEGLPRDARVKKEADFTVIGEVKGKDGRSKSVVVVTDYQRTRGDYRVPSHFVLFLDTYGEGNTLEGFVKGAGFKFERSSGSPTIIYKVDGRDHSLPIKGINDSIAEKLQARAGVFWVEQTKTGEPYPNPIVPYPDSAIIERLGGKEYEIDLREGVPVILSGGNKLAGAEYDTVRNKWVWKEIPPEALGEPKVETKGGVIFTTQEFKDWEGQEYQVVSYEVMDPVEKKTKYVYEVTYEYIEKEGDWIAKRDRIAAYYVRETSTDPASLASRSAESDFTFIVPKELQERKSYCDPGYPNMICPPVPFVRVDIKGNPKTQDNPETQGFPVAPIAWVAVIDHARARASQKPGEEIREADERIKQLRREYNGASLERRREMQDENKFEVYALGPGDRYARPHNFSLVGGMLVKFIDGFPSIQTSTSTGSGYSKLEDDRDQVEVFNSFSFSNRFSGGTLRDVWGLTSTNFQLGTLTYGSPADREELSGIKEFLSLFEKYTGTYDTFKITDKITQTT